MDRKAVAEILNEIALLLELKGENPFKSRAYYNGARIIEMLEEDLRELIKDDKLKDIRGIGSAINDKVKELLETGEIKYHQDLKESIPPGLFEMLEIPGLGPKKIKILFDELQITNIIELEYACKENRLIDLKGFGAKSQENILKGIEYLKRFKGLYYYSEAVEIASDLLNELNSLPQTVVASLAGSIRRGKETVKDIDIVASSENPKELAATFSKLKEVSDVIAQGDTKISVTLHEGINADLRVVRPEQYPYALHHFTGSKEHNTALRHRAKSMGYKMNEYGLFDGEDLIVCRDETELFGALGLEYIPPELRENTGEIEAAEQKKLPDLVSKADIKGVFHVHTTYSDGSDSLEEIIIACLEKGYQYLGINDHSQSAFYAGGLKTDDISRQHAEIDKLRIKYPDLTIFKGIESDIKTDGSLDYPDDIIEKFDFVIASVHSSFSMSSEKMTERIIKAISHPKVTMLGHPTGRLLLGREGYSLDMEQILQAASETGTVIELNASPARLDLDWRYLKRAKELGILISINPDAHSIVDLDDMDFGIIVARKGWLEKKDVFNAYSVDWIKNFVKL